MALDKDSPSILFTYSRHWNWQGPQTCAQESQEFKINDKWINNRFEIYWVIFRKKNNSLKKYCKKILSFTHPGTQWRVSKCLITGLGKASKPWFVAFANFCGVNIPVMADLNSLKQVEKRHTHLLFWVSAQLGQAQHRKYLRCEYS